LKKLTSLTCSKGQGVVFLEQLALLIQEPLRAEHFWVTPEVGVIVETPHVQDHGCVLRQKHSLLNIDKCIHDYFMSFAEIYSTAYLGNEVAIKLSVFCGPVNNRQWSYCLFTHHLFQECLIVWQTVQ